MSSSSSKDGFKVKADTYEKQKKETQRLYKCVVSMHLEGGRSTRSIASNLGISKSTVSRYIGSWKNDLPAENIRPHCRPPKIKSAEKSFLGQCVVLQDKSGQHLEHLLRLFATQRAM